MAFFRAAFTALKRVMAGEIIKQIDTSIMGERCTVSLRLKRANDSSETYVVLAFIASGNYQYVALDQSEFEQFAGAVQEIGHDLRESNRSQGLMPQ
jgi:hypothetical protein